MVKLFVVGYSLDIKQAELLAIFSMYGKINSIELLTHKESQKHKGFGFVEVEDQAVADRIIAAVNGMVIKGRKIRVKLADEDRAERPVVAKTNNFYSHELQRNSNIELADQELVKNKRPRKLITNTFRAGN